jgi:hypothetical protein
LTLVDVGTAAPGAKRADHSVVDALKTTHGVKRGRDFVIGIGIQTKGKSPAKMAE